MTQTTFETAQDVIARKNQDGTVILMKMDEASLFYKIDGIAAAVWTEMQSKTTLDNIVLKFEEQFPLHREEIKRDIPPFVKELLERKLIAQV